MNLNGYVDELGQARIKDSTSKASPAEKSKCLQNILLRS